MNSIKTRLANTFHSIRARILRARPSAPAAYLAPGLRPGKNSPLRLAYGTCYAISTGLHLNRNLVRFLTLAALLLAPMITLPVYLVLTVLLPFERPQRPNRRVALPAVRVVAHQLPAPTLLVAAEPFDEHRTYRV